MSYGLDDRYEYHELFLDSFDSSGTSVAGTPSTDTPLFVLSTPLESIAAIKVIEVQIPFAYDVFNSYNNTFLLTDDVVINAAVTIPVGNYNSITLSAQLKTSLELASPGRVYTVSFSGQTSMPNTGKFTISNNAPGVGTFSLTFGDAVDRGTLNPRIFLGFNPGVNTSDLSHVLVAPNIASISGPNYLYVNSRAFGPQIETILPEGAINLGGAYEPQFCKIPITVQPGGVIYWMDPDPQKWFSMSNLALLSQFDMFITLGNNAVPSATSLNGQSFSVKLGVLTNKFQSDALRGTFGNSGVIQGNKRGRGF